MNKTLSTDNVFEQSTVCDDFVQFYRTAQEPMPHREDRFVVSYYCVVELCHIISEPWSLVNIVGRQVVCTRHIRQTNYRFSRCLDNVT